MLPFDTRFPIFLPSDNHLTALIIEECHRKVLHNGIKETLTELRSRFWVPRGRQVVRRVIARCSVCKKFEGQHYSVPPAALPGFHLEEQFAFTSTGVDFSVPLFVKAGSNGRCQMNKVHITLFTCCSTRAIHVDLVPDLTTEAFLRCFKHFTCPRRFPRLIVSDNTKTFKSSAKKLCALFELPEVLKLFSELKIKWRFNLERAPWWVGGFFERMIDSLKRCLKKVLKNVRLTYEELLTVVTEIELVLNSRPLTYLHFDDAEELLTPSHLAVGRRLMTIPEDCTIKEEKESDVELLTRRQRYLILLLSYF